MSVRQRGKGYQIDFQWKGHRLFGACPVTSRSEAVKIEKSVKTAFKIYRFDHLDPVAQGLAMGIFTSKGWALPPDLQVPDPKHELTLGDAINDFMDADEKNRTERKVFAIDRLVESFKENTALSKITVSEILKYRKKRLEDGVSNATVNLEISALSGIFRQQLVRANSEQSNSEQTTVVMNPCSLVRKLPAKQRDTYISWVDFQRILETSDWLRPLITIMYYTGMRPTEAFDLDWSEVNFSRKIIILPPKRTKEGKNDNQKSLRDKRIPMRREVYDLLWSMRHGDGNVVRMSGRMFFHKGRPITRSTKRKCWERICRLNGLQGIDFRDLRHTFKTNLALSGVDRTIRNAIVGHATKLPVEDLYIHITDEKLLDAVNNMTFDHGQTAADFGGGEKRPVKIPSNSSEKKKGRVAARPNSLI